MGTGEINGDTGSRVDMHGSHFSESIRPDSLAKVHGKFDPTQQNFNAKVPAPQELPMDI